MYLNPNPIMFSFGSIEVRWYGFLAALGLLIAYYLIPYLYKKKYSDGKEELYQNAIFIAAIFGIIGARILHVILKWSYYKNNFIEVFYVWNGGLAFHGGLILGLISLYYYSKIVKINYLRILDLFSITLPIILALGRIGNIMNSEILGRKCNCFFNFTFSDNIPRHPVQLYAIIKNLIVFYASYKIYFNKNLKEGSTALTFLFLYSLLRFIVEFFRQEPLIFYIFDLEQILTFPIILISGYYWFKIVLLNIVKKN